MGMSTIRRYGKLILFDTLAGLCFVGVVLFGWLPGPGGIPLLILGLSLLAANHDWAERWLETAKHKGVSFKKWLFPDKPLIRALYDIGSIVLAGVGIYTLFSSDSRLVEAAATVAVTFSLFLFLLNRERFDKLSELVKRKR